MAELVNKEYDYKNMYLELVIEPDERDDWRVHSDAIKFSNDFGIEPEYSISGGFRDFEVYEISSGILNNEKLQRDVLGACAFRSEENNVEMNSMFAIYDKDKNGSLLFYTDNIKDTVNQVLGEEPCDSKIVRVQNIPYNVAFLDNRDKAREVGKNVIDIEERTYKERKHEHEVNWASKQAPPIMECHEGNRSMVVHESSSNPGLYLHSLEGSSYSVKDLDDYKQRKDIVMVIGPDRTSVFVKEEIIDTYIDKTGINVNISENDSPEEKEEKITIALAGSVHTFGDDKYFREEIPSSDSYSFAALCSNVLREVDRLEHPEIEVEKGTPLINGR